jgi:hypothetical protein
MGFVFALTRKADSVRHADAGVRIEIRLDDQKLDAHPDRHGGHFSGHSTSVRVVRLGCAGVEE